MSLLIALLCWINFLIGLGNQVDSGYNFPIAPLCRLHYEEGLIQDGHSPRNLVTGNIVFSAYNNSEPTVFDAVKKKHINQKTMIRLQWLSGKVYWCFGIHTSIGMCKGIANLIFIKQIHNIRPNTDIYSGANTNISAFERNVQFPWSPLPRGSLPFSPLLHIKFKPWSALQQGDSKILGGQFISISANSNSLNHKNSANKAYENSQKGPEAILLCGLYIFAVCANAVLLITITMITIKAAIKAGELEAIWSV